MYSTAACMVNVPASQARPGQKPTQHSINGEQRRRQLERATAMLSSRSGGRVITGCSHPLIYTSFCRLFGSALCLPACSRSTLSRPFIKMPWESHKDTYDPPSLPSAD